MPRVFFSVRRLLSAPLVPCLLLAALLCGLACADAASARMTLLVPSQPGIEAPARIREEQKKTAAQQNTVQAAAKAAPEAVQPPKPQTAGHMPDTPPAKAAEAGGHNATNPVSADAVRDEEALRTPPINEEVDVLISMMRPFRHEGLPMDMPQLFAVLRYDEHTPLRDGALQPERHDLLGDVEEIRYLDQKAWGANVALSRPGLYQFIIEARPWWDAARDRFVQHYVKTTLPVYGVERGWELPVGQRFEIQPLTRPFGLTAPALFSGRVLFNGTPLDNAPVRMARINTDKQNAPTPWHEELAARTDSEGRFAFVLNQPGWWCCAATAAGDPLKGQDGQPKPLELGALFWLYVDGAAEARKR
ncbi:DUF4198 domain-containing protein [uncultured Desulfovibrio sp.]|uniref:DUF4198 domain-containing protein n=1 Tax=uncultured Desulfovibrio sp. TaxID=167968 RepID=UPI0026034874|nr:DUF4198 domain-containing protein [uncultured Desulfovibrio sp.]